MTTKTQRYLVHFRLVGEQTTWVIASSKGEAKRKAIAGIDIDPVDFNVLNILRSTVEVVDIEDDL